MAAKDEPLHMLMYWFEKVGVEECFSTYYPNLAQKPVIRPQLEMYLSSSRALTLICKGLADEARDEDDCDDSD
jgi:hypothetical protein